MPTRTSRARSITPRSTSRRSTRASASHGRVRGWRVTVPAHYHVGHEAHFGQVAQEFLRHVAAGALPAWEEPCMLAKYYTTTQALALARARG